MCFSPAPLPFVVNAMKKKKLTAREKDWVGYDYLLLVLHEFWQRIPSSRYDRELHAQHEEAQAALRRLRQEMLELKSEHTKLKLERLRKAATKP